MLMLMVTQNARIRHDRLYNCCGLLALFANHRLPICMKLLNRSSTLLLLLYRCIKITSLWHDLIKLKREKRKIAGSLRYGYCELSVMVSICIAPHGFYTSIAYNLLICNLNCNFLFQKGGSNKYAIYRDFYWCYYTMPVKGLIFNEFMRFISIVWAAILLLLVP